MAKKCSKCGKELADDDFYCTQCGAKQEKMVTEPVIVNNSVVNNTATPINYSHARPNIWTLENCKKVTYAAGVLTVVSVFCNFMELKLPGLADWSFSVMDISSLLGLYIIFLGSTAMYGTFINKFGSSFAVNLGNFLGIAIGFYDAYSTLGANLTKVMGMGSYLLLLGPLVGGVGNIMCQLVQNEKSLEVESFFSEMKDVVLKQTTDLNGMKLPNYAIAILVIVLLEVVSSQVNLDKIGW